VRRSAFFFCTAARATSKASSATPNCWRASTAAAWSPALFRGVSIFPIQADGTVRTPIWKQGELIGPDQYTVVKDPSKRNRYGTRTLAKAKPETIFWYRMAGWPAAFEAGMIEACKRHFPVGEFSIYGQGHSTGGPFIC